MTKPQHVRNGSYSVFFSSPPPLPSPIIGSRRILSSQPALPLPLELLAGRRNQFYRIYFFAFNWPSSDAAAASANRREQKVAGDKARRASRQTIRVRPPISYGGLPARRRRVRCEGASKVLYGVLCTCHLRLNGVRAMTDDGRGGGEMALAMLLPPVE